MSRYEWPHDVRAKEHDDEPAQRAGYLAKRRIELDSDETLVPAGAAPAPVGGHHPRAPQTGRHLLWQPLGPFTVVGGQAIGTPRIAGRVNAVAVESKQGQRVYIASANGGVWYSSDGGAHWKSLGGFAPTQAAEINRPAHRNACGAIYVVFGDTEADDDVYVGTGETTHGRDAQPGSSLGGIGILFAHGPAASNKDDPWQREAKNLIGQGVYRFAAIFAADGKTVTNVIAATTTGLYERPASPAADLDWNRVAGTVNQRYTDVVWTKEVAPRPERLWVWVQAAAGGGLQVRSGATNKFDAVALAGAQTAQRAALAAPSTQEHIFVLHDRYPTARPTLYRVDNAGAALPAGTIIDGVPDIFGRQGFYDIAMAVDPKNSNRVVLGGSTFNTKGPDGSKLEGDAAIVLGEVALKDAKLTFGHPAPFTMIGVGVHADVHDLKYSKDGDRLWATCDGGIYRSDRPAEQVGFFPCNDGLSIIESNYVACHPKCEGHIVTGLQDNGVIARLSNGVWRNAGLGDGGGVVFDPMRPDRFIREHFQAYWSSSEGSVKAEALLTRGSSFAKAEFDNSAFYSSAASVTHKRGSPAPAQPNVGQIIVGTNRVWYTENFGGKWQTPAGKRRWVTLPTGTDPLPANLKQDGFGQQITVCRWQTSDVAWILGQGTLMRYARTAESDKGGGPGTWARETILERVGKAVDPVIGKSAVWTDVAVNLDSPGAPHGAKGAVYLGTIGKPGDDTVDTLWWFDGDSKWFKTGLLKDPQGTPPRPVPAPVTSIVCDPAFPDEVYVGTTIGVWKGVRSQVGANDPTWKWESLLNGLPEAAVEDLAIFSDGGLRLLRAAIAARGVWELRLDLPDVEDRVYIRAHDDDLRYRDRAFEQKRDLKHDRSWHGSPDVRPRRANQVRPAPKSLPWKKSTKGINADLLRNFQSALRSQSGDLRVRPTGRWDDYFNEVLRDQLVPPLAPGAKVAITKSFWENNIMIEPHAKKEPWSSAIPWEADLYDFVEALKEGDADMASCSLPPEPLKVDVVVHFRGLDKVKGEDIRVALLWWTDPALKKKAKPDKIKTWPVVNPGSGDPETVGWTAAVNQALNGDGTNETLSNGWKFALGDTGAKHYQTLEGQELDPMHSGITTFDLDLTELKDKKKTTLVLLVAVIRFGTDVALDEKKLQELVLTNHNVAVRSIKIAP